MSDAPDAPVYSKDRPFLARLAENRILNKVGSAKETRHLVVEIAGSGLAYEAGDSLGVLPKNRPSEVEEILGLIGAAGDELVSLPNAAEPVTIREALTSRLSLSGPTRRFLEAVAVAASPAERAGISALLAPYAGDALEQFLAEREFVDLLAEYPSARFTPQSLASQMRRLVPRLYSIASSPKAHPGEVHLTVAVVRYRTNGRERFGACSTYLADRVGVGPAVLPVFVTHSHFKPPADGSRDLIMVGPGTGIAPFRAFIQERAATGATGRNWLFFGEQRRASDFLYEEEWNRALAAGVLSRMDTAFSRDQAGKIYVQDRMRENAAELWRWIESGAFFHVCGDARRMAKDVEAALLEIVAERGGMPAAQAADYVRRMKKERRYQRDVY